MRPASEGALPPRGCALARVDFRGPPRAAPRCAARRRRKRALERIRNRDAGFAQPRHCRRATARAAAVLRTRRARAGRARTPIRAAARRLSRRDVACAGRRCRRTTARCLASGAARVRCRHRRRQYSQRPIAGGHAVRIGKADLHRHAVARQRPGAHSEQRAGVAGRGHHHAEQALARARIAAARAVPAGSSPAPISWRNVSRTRAALSTMSTADQGGPIHAGRATRARCAPDIRCDWLRPPRAMRSRTALRSASEVVRHERALARRIRKRAPRAEQRVEHARRDRRRPRSTRRVRSRDRCRVARRSQVPRRGPRRRSGLGARLRGPLEQACLAAHQVPGAARAVADRRLQPHAICAVEATYRSGPRRFRRRLRASAVRSSAVRSPRARSRRGPRDLAHALCIGGRVPGCASTSAACGRARTCPSSTSRSSVGVSQHTTAHGPGECARSPLATQSSATRVDREAERLRRPQAFDRKLSALAYDSHSHARPSGPAPRAGHEIPNRPGAGIVPATGACANLPAARPAPVAGSGRCCALIVVAVAGPVRLGAAQAKPAGTARRPAAARDALTPSAPRTPLRGRHAALPRAPLPRSDPRVRAIGLARSNAEVWFDIGRAHEQLGEYGLAIDSYQRYLRDRVDAPGCRRARRATSRSLTGARSREAGAPRACRAARSPIDASQPGAIVLLDGRKLGVGRSIGFSSRARPAPTRGQPHRLHSVPRRGRRAGRRPERGVRRYAAADAPAAGSPPRLWTWIAAGASAAALLTAGGCGLGRSPSATTATRRPRSAGLAHRTSRSSAH